MQALSSYAWWEVNLQFQEMQSQKLETTENLEENDIYQESYLS